MAERELVTIREIDSISPIEGADRIELARVGGWTVVVGRGDFAPGDRCVYFELDSFLDTADPRFAFLASGGERTTADGRTGVAIKTARLRGVFSQGLAMPLQLFPELDGLDPSTNLAELIGVTKWEPPVPADLAADVIGGFPSEFARKTDSERVQNLGDAYAKLRSAADWVATEKIDGSSATFGMTSQQLRVSGRNWEYAESNANVMWSLARSLRLEDLLDNGWAVQAEIFGEGIQSNPLRIEGQRLAVFEVLQNRVLVPRPEWPLWAAELAAPIHDFVLPETIEEALDQVDGLDSKITPGRRAEGIVWHTADGTAFDELDGRSNFKVISNRYLLENDR